MSTKIKHIIVRWYFVCDKQIEGEWVEHAGQETMLVMIVLKADLAEKVTGFVKTEWAIWLNEQRLFQSEKKTTAQSPQDLCIPGILEQQQEFQSSWNNNQNGK